MQLVLRFICAVSLCLINTSAVIADPITDIYQIEVIVFEHNDPHRFKSENWPKFAGKLDLTHAVNLNKLQKNVPESIDTLETLDALDDAGDIPVKKITAESINLVEPQNYILKSELKNMKNSSAERFIKHIAWMQPLANNVKSTPVYFTAGNDAEITALFSIKPNRNIFNVAINALYKIQDSDRKFDPGVDEIKITRDVRVKKKEVFYVDHPVIGMIIIISPVLYGNSAYTPLPNQ